MSNKLGIFICGFTGRMGQLIGKQVLADKKMQLLGACAAKESKEIGEDLGLLLGGKSLGVCLTKNLSDAISAADLSSKDLAVIIDFSHSSATAINAKIAEKNKLPLMVGTTALKKAELNALKLAAKKIPVLVASNTSIGANVLFALTRQAAKALPQAQIEIAEIHHSGKKDSPSGTALQLAEEAAKARNLNLADHLVLDRNTKGPRKANDISVTGIRGGSVKGEHTVYFFNENEYIEIKHCVSDAVVFAEGAIKAAKYLIKQKSGLYGMENVLK